MGFLDGNGIRQLWLDLKNRLSGKLDAAEAVNFARLKTLHSLTGEEFQVPGGGTERDHYVTFQVPLDELNIFFSGSAWFLLNITVDTDLETLAFTGIHTMSHPGFTNMVTDNDPSPFFYNADEGKFYVKMNHPSLNGRTIYGFDIMFTKIGQ